jgi:hypothetical protein
MRDGGSLGVRAHGPERAQVKAARHGPELGSSSVQVGSWAGNRPTSWGWGAK